MLLNFPRSSSVSHPYVSGICTSIIFSHLYYDVFFVEFCYNTSSVRGSFLVMLDRICEFDFRFNMRLSLYDAHFT